MTEQTITAPERRGSTRMRILKDDAVLTDSRSQGLALEALLEIAEPGTVGEHISFRMDADRLGTHYFVSTSKAYPDWRWAVSVARAPRAKVATVCETNLVPSSSSVLAPEWVPYADRLAPGDIRAGDVTPYMEDDPRLEAGFEATGEEDVDQVAFFELGLGRKRVLSAEGREEAAQRWYDGDHGPKAEVARKASSRCSSCGYYLPMAGVLRQQFGVCANDWSPADGKVVALNFGCGAHSEVDVEATRGHDAQNTPVLDEFDSDLEVEAAELSSGEETVEKAAQSADSEAPESEPAKTETDPQAE